MTSSLTEYKPLHIESNKNQNTRGQSREPGASYERTRRERESQKDREAKLDRQRLRANHLVLATIVGSVVLFINLDKNCLGFLKKS